MYSVCQDCREEVKMDLMLPDELWEKITSDGVFVLGASCMVKRLENKKLKYVYKLLQLWRPDIKWNPEDQDKNALCECDTNHTLVYFHGQDCPMCNKRK